MTGKSKVNVLLVDDQPGKLLSYEVILKDLDETLIKASSAREALDRLLRNEVAVVLIDVCLPDIDGYQLASMIRDHPRFEKIAIIFISAIYLSDLDQIRGYERGAVDYVSVPVVAEILRAKVKILVELHRKTRELEQLNCELENRVAERTAALQISNVKLRESEERLRLAGEAAEFGAYDCDFQTGLISCSPQMKRLLGIEAAGDLDFESFLDLIYPQDRDAVQGALFTPSRITHRRHRIEFRILQKDGSARWLLACGGAFFSDADSDLLTRVMGTVLGFTERKQVEERHLLLMAELDHRVKNILANVRAIARLSSKRTSSVNEFVELLDARIKAISKAHSLLREDSWIGISLRNYIGEILEPFMSRQGENINLVGEAINLLPKAAQSLALVLHELATNAVKYGSLSVPNGKVRIAWERVPDGDSGFIRLIWDERGGPPTEKPSGDGFGMTVIKAAAAELGAEANHKFGPSGVFLKSKDLLRKS